MQKNYFCSFRDNLCVWEEPVRIHYCAPYQGATLIQQQRRYQWKFQSSNAATVLPHSYEVLGNFW